MLNDQVKYLIMHDKRTYQYIIVCSSFRYLRKTFIIVIFITGMLKLQKTVDSYTPSNLRWDVFFICLILIIVLTYQVVIFVSIS